MKNTLFKNLKYWPVFDALLKELVLTYIKFLKKEITIETAQKKINSFSLQTWISKEKIIEELQKIKLEQKNKQKNNI